ncbi:MAG: preprotein translocase subunit SecG [Pseudomonadales bacterium]|nr:preprotein translocase subunit SecG [Halioglobus sp.]MCP5130429.1 preprotein translocase subunit SecG [Pseudomonadales bacterium]
MEQIVLVVHLLVALTIIGLIMLQQGKGADMGASFGAGASQTLFGSSGSGNVLTRATSWLVALFFATSFGLAWLANQQSSAAVDFDIEIPTEVEVTAPAAVQEVPVIEEEIPAVVVPGEDMPELDQ